MWYESPQLSEEWVLLNSDNLSNEQCTKVLLDNHYHGAITELA
jgi:hypothetical protein